MEERNTAFSFTIIMLLLAGVALLALAFLTYLPKGEGGEQFTHPRAFRQGPFAAVKSSASGCGSNSSSSVSTNEKDMLATPPSVPGYIGMDVFGMSADLKLSEYKDKAFPVVICAGDMSGQLSFSSSGIASFSDNLSTTTVSDTYKETGSVAVHATGTGQLSAALKTTGEGEDNSAYSRSKILTVYILAKENRLYISESGFIALRIKHLKWLRDTGKINQSEYKQRLRDLATIRAETDNRQSNN